MIYMFTHANAVDRNLVLNGIRTKKYLSITMKNVTPHPRIVEAMIDSEVTIKGQRFVEYFNDPGNFYPEDLETPTGIGVYFQDENNLKKDWFKAGLVTNIETIHFKETKWWAVIKNKYLTKITELLEEKQAIQAKIDHTEMILFDPITHYSKEMVDEN